MATEQTNLHHLKVPSPDTLGSSLREHRPPATSAALIDHVEGSYVFDCAGNLHRRM